MPVAATVQIRRDISKTTASAVEGLTTLLIQALADLPIPYTATHKSFSSTLSPMQESYREKAVRVDSVQAAVIPGN